jgi:IS4 transposase
VGKSTSSSVASELVRILPEHWIRSKAVETGAVSRRRRIDVVPFLWCLVMAPTAGATRSLDNMQRLFQTMGEVIVCRSSFLRRFNDGFERFLMACIYRVVECQQTSVRVAKVFSQFRDVLILDSTVMALSNCLQGVFPGPRKNSCPASVKLNAIYSVMNGSIHSVVIAEGTRSEMRMRRFGKWMDGNLLLLDLGYYNHGIFERIDHYRGHFVSRLHPNANPVIVSENLTGPGRRKVIEGQKIKSVLRGLKREILDVNVRVTCRRKGNAGVIYQSMRVFRVVGIFNEQARRYHLYLTNLSPEQMDATELASVYQARWLVELAFHELKNSYLMAPKIAKKDAVVRCLILVCVLNLLVCRAVLEVLRRRLIRALSAQGRFKHEVRFAVMIWTPELRFAAVFAVLVPLLLPEILRASGLVWSGRHLDDILMLSMVDPNRSRELLLDRLERLGR